MLDITQNPREFLASLTDVRSFNNALKAVKLNRDGQITVTQLGIEFFVQEYTYVKATLFIPAAYFNSFDPPNINLVVCVDLNILTECLNIFANYNTFLEMTCKDEYGPFVIKLKTEDQKLITECSLKTKNIEFIAPLDLAATSSTTNIIAFKGQDFSALFSELDRSGDNIKIEISDGFKYTVLDVMQAYSDFVIPEASPMILGFRCTVPTKAIYKLPHLRKMSKAFAIAQKVEFLTDSTGILCIKVYSNEFPGEKPSTMNMEFQFLPLFQDDE